MLKRPNTIIVCILLVLSTVKTQAGLFDVFFFQLNTIVYKQSVLAPSFNSYHYEYYAKDKVETISGTRKTEYYSRSPTNNRFEKDISTVKTDSFAVTFNKKGFIKKYLKRFPVSEPFHNHYDEPDSIIFDFEYKLTKKRAIVYETINSYKKQTISAKSQIIAYYDKDRICDSVTIINEISEPEYRRGTESITFIFSYNQERTHSYTVKRQNNKVDTIEYNQYTNIDTGVEQFMVLKKWCKATSQVTVKNLLSKDTTELSKAYYQLYSGIPLDTKSNTTETKCIYTSSGMRKQYIDSEYFSSQGIETCIDNGIKQSVTTSSYNYKGSHGMNGYNQTTRTTYYNNELKVEGDGSGEKNSYNITISNY